jgi:hypothetical protein
LGNGYVGVRITDGVSNNLIGGTAPGSGNTIAFNAAGIVMTGDGVFGNAMLSNSLFSNGGLGIDLAEDGVTPNDVLDQDSGPNRLQNYPYIAAVTRMPTFVKIIGLLVSAPNATYRVEFFSNNSCDPSGFGEGQTFLGYTVVQPNPVGIANFRVNLPVVLANGAFITATATDAAGNTSEFSQCFGPIK